MIHPENTLRAGDEIAIGIMLPVSLGVRKAVILETDDLFVENPQGWVEQSCLIRFLKNGEVQEVMLPIQA